MSDDRAYEDELIITRESDDTEYEELPIFVDGVESKLLNFAVCKCEPDMKPMIATKVRTDKKMILYYLLEGGEECVECLRETAKEEYPDYELRDMLIHIRHHMKLEEKFSKAGVELKEHV